MRGLVAAGDRLLSKRSTLATLGLAVEKSVPVGKKSRMRPLVSFIGEEDFGLQCMGDALMRSELLKNLVDHADAVTVDHLPALPAGEQENADHGQR